MSINTPLTGLPDTPSEPVVETQPQGGPKDLWQTVYQEVLKNIDGGESYEQ